MRFIVGSFVLALATAAAAYPDPSKCKCPKDNDNCDGVHINQGVIWYQCAYPDGACMWNGPTGALMNTAQTNCPTNAPCPSGICTCPKDKTGCDGVLINTGTPWYQCAYTNGACMWEVTGALLNTAQTNCPSWAQCQV